MYFGDFEKKNRNRDRERRFHSFMISAVLAVVLWVLNTLVSVRETLADIRPRINQIEINASGAYRSSDAKRDQAEVGARFDRVEARVGNLEKHP